MQMKYLQVSSWQSDLIAMVEELKKLALIQTL